LKPNAEGLVMHAVVVGAGIVGASVGYHLARQGVSVQILEAGRPGAGTSSATFAYLNAVRSSGDYAALRLRAIQYWDQLAAEIDATDVVHRDGSIFYTSTAADAAELERHVSEASSAGLVCQRWTARAVVEELEPDLILPDTDHPIVRMPEEGRIEPAPMIGRLLAAACDLGARVASGEHVEAVDRRGSSVRVVTNLRSLDADCVVYCVGPQTEAALRRLGVDLPVRTQPGVTIVTRPLPVRLRHVVYAGKIHFKPDGGGRLLAGRTDYRKDMPDERESRARARETVSLLRPWLRGIGDGDEIEAVRVGVRPIPADGLPMVGPVPGVGNAYVAVMHSGVSLGGLMGRLLAEEIVSGTENAALLAYRPQRFLNGAPRRDDFAPWGPGDDVKTTIAAHA
jgi:glycine/D-amino acid oxidase-like deaminating enzyme